MLLLRQLFEVAGGGTETDAFKHLAAAFTVLRSLGTAKTTSNSESSRIVSTGSSLNKVVICALFSIRVSALLPRPEERKRPIFFTL